MKKILTISALIGMSLSSIAFAEFERNPSSANTPIPPSPLFSSPGYNGGSNPVADPGFEGGTPNADWDEASSNFGTPICDAGACGTGGATNGPASGTFWTWFGGIAGSEIGSVSQSVTIPNGSATLSFQLQMFVCDSADDFMAVDIDGTEVFRILGDDAICTVDAYTEQMVDISAFADGGAHTVTFSSEIFATNGAGSNFFVDDVVIEGMVPVELMNFSID
ncbi:MAG: hypothetical protein AB8B80_06260 [Marinicellaceae bacterium]